jgi:hypothetical protein
LKKKVGYRFKKNRCRKNIESDEFEVFFVNHPVYIVTTGASGGRARTTVGTGDRCDVSNRSRLGDTDAVEKLCTYLLEGNQLNG